MTQDQQQQQQPPPQQQQQHHQQPVHGNRTIRPLNRDASTSMHLHNNNGNSNSGSKNGTNGKGNCNLKVKSLTGDSAGGSAVASIATNSFLGNHCGGGGNNNSGCNSGPTGNDMQKSNRICRDFLQGSCRRKYCRYPHVVSTEQIVFCHDFQNSSCPRINCKFLHYTLEEEDYYRKYGKFPQIHNEYMPPDQPNGLPCSEMQMNGHCRHRECQYSHISQAPPPSRPQQHNGPTAGGVRRLDCDPKWANDRSMMIRFNGGAGGNGGVYDNQLQNDYGSNNGGGGGNGSRDEFGSLKRPNMNDRYEPFKRFRDDNDSISSNTDVMAILRRFEEEHNMLRRRVEANEVKIAELRASNDYLMSQNAQIRLSNAQQCSRVVNPVTVTTSQPQATQVLNAVSIAPVQMQATPIVSMAAPQTQIIASSSCPPLALAAANTSQGQQLALAQQSINTLSTTTQPMNAAHASQILGTSQITLTPTLATAPSMGLAINTSQALAMSNATQPIISYPVMTHSILPH